MFDPEVDPVTGLPAGVDPGAELAGVLGVLDPEPTAGQLGFIAALDAAELAGLNAAEEPVSPWAATQAVAGRARTMEILTRQAQARGLVQVHALFTQVLADDAAYYWGVRDEALEFAADEVAAALGVSRRTAQIRIDDAIDLVESCPRALALLQAGVLACPVARALAHETGRAPAEVRDRVQSRVLDLVGGSDLPGLGALTPEQIQTAAAVQPEACWRVGQVLSRGRVIRLVRQVILDLGVELPAAEPSRTPVDVEAFPTTPGRMMLGADLTEADGTTALAHLHQQARVLKNTPGETRSIGELRVQAFADLVTGRTPPGPTSTTSGGSGPAPVGPAPFDVHLTIDATRRLATPRYGQLHPDALPAILAAAVASGGTVRTNQITLPACPGTHPDPTAQATHPDRHDPAPALTAAIRMRDRTCRFPGCTIPAGRCDLDHTLPWPHGPTCPCNLGCLCRHHHRLKTLGRWKLTNHGHGHLTWTTPTGRTIETWPDS